MKRKTTKEILAESFIELSRTKDIDKITVKNITDNCGYSPATFYRQFTDKYDLIAWSYAETVAAVMNKIGKETYTWKDTLLDGAKIFMEEREIFANLFLHTTGHDAFIRYMTDINYEALKKYILKNNPELKPDQKIEMYMRMYCLGTVSLSCEWILGRYNAEPEELAEVYKNSVPQPLLPYLELK